MSDNRTAKEIADDLENEAYAAIKARIEEGDKPKLDRLEESLIRIGISAGIAIAMGHIAGRAKELTA